MGRDGTRCLFRGTHGPGAENEESKFSFGTRPIQPGLVGCVRLSAFVGKPQQTIYKVRELGSLITNIEKILKNFQNF